MRPACDARRASPSARPTLSARSARKTSAGVPAAGLDPFGNLPHRSLTLAALHTPRELGSPGSLPQFTFEGGHALYTIIAGETAHH